MLVWKKRTNAGRVVYSKPRHFFSPGRLARAATGIINREPASIQPDTNYFGWKSVASVATAAYKAIGFRWGEGEIVTKMWDLRRNRDARAILAMRDYIRGMRSILGEVSRWTSWVPYVGDVLGVGVPLMDLFINTAEINMPMIGIDPETGAEVIYW